MKSQNKIVEKRIFLPRKKHKALQAETESAPSTIFQALNYNSSSEKSLNIRRLAYASGEAKVLVVYERPMTEDDISKIY